MGILFLPHLLQHCCLQLAHVILDASSPKALWQVAHFCPWNGKMVLRDCCFWPLDRGVVDSLDAGRMSIGGGGVAAMCSWTGGVGGGGAAATWAISSASLGRCWRNALRCSPMMSFLRSQWNPAEEGPGRTLMGGLAEAKMSSAEASALVSTGFSRTTGGGVGMS